MNKAMEMLESIEKNGMMGKGKAEMIRHLEGETLTFRQACLAKCYDCTGFLADGKEDCCIPECALYPFMPYGKKPERNFTLHPKKVMSEERIQKMRDGLAKRNAI